ncbi:MAG: transglutaminase family protein [Acidimicrobiales bacterium]
MTTPEDRLAALLAEPGDRLDQVLAVIASVVDDAPDEAAIVAEFDTLAAPLIASSKATEPSPETVLAFVHGELGFVGNVTRYYSPSNSLIHRVLRSRKGIPLSLAAVAVELARRVDVSLTVVGMPGHVVLGDGSTPNRWFDPFGAGAELDVDDCRRIFSRFSPVESFSPTFLQPIDRRIVAIRTLNNLKGCYRELGDLAQLARVLELSVRVPGIPISERHELAVVLAGLGRDDLAAAHRDALVELDPERADAHRAAARIHRARRN